MQRVFIAMVLGLVAAVGFAQTPDGDTPANEGVCDDLMSATPGLYGLCVAFCEAQDCEPNLAAEDPFENCNPSNPKLLEIYNRKKQEGDPDMPCIKAPCPCWTEEQIAQIFGRGRPGEVCLDVNAFYVYGYNYDWVYDQWLAWPYVHEYTYALVDEFNPDFFPSFPEGRCQWWDREWDFTIGDWAVNEIVILDITPEETVSCRDSVQARAADAGITCTVIP